jgi:hypothetical protein
MPANAGENNHGLQALFSDYFKMQCQIVIDFTMVYPWHMNLPDINLL